TGSITFVPMEGTLGPGGGSAIDEGRYRIDKGLRVGEYQVKIQGTRPGQKRVQDPLAPARLVRDTVQVVPPEYNQNSKLIRMVNAGSNSIDFDLKGFDSKGARTGK